MLATDETAVICDLAETYGILNYKALPVSLLAALCSGLRDDSRIKMEMSGASVNRMETMIAAAADSLSTLVWFKTADGQKGRNRPPSILALLLGTERRENGIQSFDTPEAFEAARAKIIGGDA